MKVTTIMQFFLGLVVCNCHVAVSGSLYGNETDRLALLDFKNAISFDPQQALLSWNDSTHFCNWEGVLCRVKTPFRVTSLNLTNRGLVGKISPSLGNLTFLKHLVLPKNAFVGEIPQSFGHLHRLQTLYLTNNTLRGRIPSLANCTELKVLWLNRNQLAGQFPADLPPRLQELQLSYNELTGIIPASLANITMLTKLTCASNHFEGNIPNEFAKFPVLLLLYMGGNKFRGSFPQAILNISTLMDFSLALCDLSGELPPNLGSSLSNLEMLELPANFFRGHIPYSLTNASNLYYIELSRNNFTGMVPRTIGKLTKLTWLNLEFNKLQARNKQDWEFMNSLTNCTELQLFSMTGNHLEGHVPNSLGNLSNKIQNLHLAINQLSGGFPSGIAHLPNLFIVALGMNGFTGAVPEWLGSLKKLQTISLHNNMFTGFIPSSFSNLSQLGVLSLEFNQFSGNIPPNLGSLPMLQLLSISNNNLHGSIPKEIFAIPTILQISLSFNNLDATLHTDIGNAKQLTYLQLSSNKLSGDIPNTLGDCESLENIEMDGNILSGIIPTSLGNIHSLKVLNLSHNNLSGSIPASLGNLELLEQLDLSNNQLKGEVPKRGIFGNATAMQIDDNQGLCGGPIELHLPACYMTPLNSTKHKLSVVLKVVIPLVSMVTLAMAISLLLLWRAREKRKCVSLPSIGTKFPKVSYSDLAKATEGFSTTKLIGRGRYSSVYQGKLFQHRNPVAIKVFSLETKGAQKSFIVECNALRNVRHRNLVPILTACSSIDSRGNDFKALVYELMPRGDLHMLLYAHENSSALNHITLAQRLRIVVDISDALMYLHHNNQDTIVHCDLKPSNILMDDNMIAHVGDFGLARLKNHWTTSSHGDSTLSIAIKGTIGYVSPECATGAQVSTSGDVYSFGIVLLEIFLRKRPTHDMFKGGMNIVNFVEMNFPDRISHIVDPELLKDQPDFPEETPVAMKGKDLDCLLSVLNIGLCCTKLSPNERPNMQEVAARLHRIRDAYLRGN